MSSRPAGAAAEPPGRAERAARAEQRRLYRARLRRRRLVLVVVALSACALLIASLRHHGPKMTPLEARIVSAANSQIGYHTDPAHSYCNKFSAHFVAGSTACPSGERSEEWCADFAAWAWQRAGIRFTYGYQPGELNGAAVSFYEWGIDNGTWHPASSGYRARPGDVAVYGLSSGSDPSAVHVAIVTDDPAGQRGPDVVNGDGDRTGFSVVEIGTDEVRADVHDGRSELSGYVSPTRPGRTALAGRS